VHCLTGLGKLLFCVVSFLFLVGFVNAGTYGLGGPIQTTTRMAQPHAVDFFGTDTFAFAYRDGADGDKCYFTACYTNGTKRTNDVLVNNVSTTSSTIDLCSLNSTTLVVTYDSKWKAFDINGTNVTNEYSCSSCGNPVQIVCLDSDSFLLAGSVGTKGKYQVWNVNGTNETNVILFNDQEVYSLCAKKISSERVLFVYGDGATTIKFTVWNISSGTAIVAETSTGENLDTQDPYNMGCGLVDSDFFVIAWRGTDDDGHMKGYNIYGSLVWDAVEYDSGTATGAPDIVCPLVGSRFVVTDGSDYYIVNMYDGTVLNSSSTGGASQNSQACVHVPGKNETVLLSIGDGITLVNHDAFMWVLNYSNVVPTISLNSPIDGSVVPPPALLNISVSDTDGDSLDVYFYEYSEKWYDAPSSGDPPVSSYMSRFAFGDIDGDGRIDLLQRYSTTFSAYTWNGSGWESNDALKTGLSSSGGQYEGLFLYDFGSDGVMDLVWAPDLNTLNSSSWNGTQWVHNATLQPPDPGTRLAPFIYDLDNDGTPDMLLSGTGSGIQWGYTWNGTAWNSNNTVRGGLGALDSDEYCQMAFFEANDGDNYPEAVIDCYSKQFYGYEWNGSQWVVNSSLVSGLAVPQVYGTGIAAIDFDGDGLVEITANRIGSYEWTSNLLNKNSSVGSGSVVNSWDAARGVHKWFVRTTDGEEWKTSGLWSFTANNAPTLANVSVYPSTPLNTSNLVCEFTITDVDGDTVNGSVIWYKDGVLQGTYNETVSCTSGLLCNTSIGVSHTATNLTENWTCSVNGTDFINHTGWTNSTAVMITKNVGIPDMSPASVSITMYCDQSVSQTMTINNTGDGNLTRCNMSMSGSGLSISYNDSDFNVSVATPFYVKVTISNPSVGTHNELLTVTCDADGLGTLTTDDSQFTVTSSTRPAAGGGGAVADTVVVLGNATWEMTTDYGGSSYSWYMGTETRTAGLNIYNPDSLGHTIELSCVDTIEGSCERVVFKDNTLYVGAGNKTKTEFNVTMEENDTELSFVIQGVDEGNNVDSITVYAGRNELISMFMSFLGKFFGIYCLTNPASEAARPIPVPIFFIAIIPAFLVFSVLFKLIGTKKLGLFITSTVSFILFVIIVMLLPASTVCG